MASQDPWQDVKLNQNNPSSCSPPQPDPHWRGLVINAPKQVKFKKGGIIDEYGAFAAIPLCTFYRFDLPNVPISENYSITAKDLKTGQIFKGDIVDLDPGSALPPPSLPGAAPTPPPRPGSAKGGYMNPNLANFLNIPQESATYEVFMSYRGFNSNKVVIELIKQ
ncbi:hypothetical protein [Acanthopleuribacter pedis]|nr:hypothetical protein [Acanthopleuribacter pedis]